MQKKGEKVDVKTLSMLVKEEGHPMCMIRSTPHGSNSMLFLTALLKRNHQSQDKAVPSPVDSWTNRHTMKASAQCLGKVTVSQEAEPQWHMQRRSSQGGHQNQVWSIAACMLMLHPGVCYLDYLGFKVLGCPTESVALSSKDRFQSYCLPALGGLWACSDAGVQPVKREPIFYILVQGKCQK